MLKIIDVKRCHRGSWNTHFLTYYVQYSHTVQKDADFSGRYPNFLEQLPLRGELHIDFRMQCVIMTQTRWPPPTSCHLSHPQNVDKIDSFLTLVLNICILGSLILGLGELVIKEGAGILYQIFRFSGVVYIWCRIHQCKSWCYLGLSQTSKVVFL